MKFEVSPFDLLYDYVCNNTKGIDDSMATIKDIWFDTIKASMSLLRKNWDSYGALPIDKPTLNDALIWLRNTMIDDTPLPNAVPTVVGGVQFEWHFDGGDIEVTFSPKKVVELFYDGKYFDRYRKGGSWGMDKWVVKIITSCV